MADVAYNGGRAKGFIWDPIAGASTLLCRPVRYTVHMTAVRAPDIYGPGKGPGGSYAHYHMPRKGNGRQHQLLHHWAYADLGGNGRTIAAETEGVPGDRMTEDQLDAHARAFADAVLHRGVPNRIATYKDTTGLAWHRLGCKGNFGAFSPGDRTTWCGYQTGQQWTTHFGKTCPTDNFIHQIPEIYNRAQVYIKAGSTAGTIEERDWLDMADKQDVIDAVWEALSRDVTVTGGDTRPLYGMIRDIWYQKDVAADIPRQVAMYDIKVSGATKATLGVDNINFAQGIRYATAGWAEGRNQTAALRGEVAGLKAAVLELAKAEGVDQKALQEAVEAATTAGVKAALKDAEITLKIED